MKSTIAAISAKRELTNLHDTGELLANEEEQYNEQPPSIARPGNDDPEPDRLLLLFALQLDLRFNLVELSLVERNS